MLIKQVSVSVFIATHKCKSWCASVSLDLIYMNGLLNLNVEAKLLCSADDSYTIERKKYLMSVK